MSQYGPLRLHMEGGGPAYRYNRDSQTWQGEGAMSGWERVGLSHMGEPNVKLFIASSLDGFIARTDGSVDWLFTDDDYGYAEFYETVDVLVMGRKTYDQVLGFGEWPYQGKDCYVFTHRGLRGQPGRVYAVSGEPARVLEQIRERARKGIWLVGGADLVTGFRSRQLIDEYILSIHPILLGEGIPLFANSAFGEKLALVTSKSYSSGLVQLHYVRQAEAKPEAAITQCAERNVVP